MVESSSTYGEWPNYMPEMRLQGLENWKNGGPYLIVPRKDLLHREILAVTDTQDWRILGTEQDWK